MVQSLQKSSSFSTGTGVGSVIWGTVTPSANVTTKTFLILSQDKMREWGEDWGNEDAHESRRGRKQRRRSVSRWGKNGENTPLCRIETNKRFKSSRKPPGKFVHHIDTNRGRLDTSASTRSCRYVLFICQLPSASLRLDKILLHFLTLKMSPFWGFAGSGCKCNISSEHSYHVTSWICYANVWRVPCARPCVKLVYLAWAERMLVFPSMSYIIDGS